MSRQDEAFPYLEDLSSLLESFEEKVSSDMLARRSSSLGRLYSVIDSGLALASIS